MSRSLSDLLEALREGERPGLSLPEIEALLTWLTGSATRDAEESLQKPEHDPVLLQMVLYRLDSILFSGGDLRLEGAGLTSDQPTDLRRIRFRRLASAFHPDRFPQLSDWLTERSQAIHRAYASFKKNPAAPDFQPQASGRHKQDMRRAPARQRKHRFWSFANGLRARFGNDRYLAHKLIGGFALLALLPVLNIALAPSVSKDPISGEGQTDAVSGFRFPIFSGSGEKNAKRGADEAVAIGDDTDRVTSLPGQARPSLATLEANSGSARTGAGNGVSAQDVPPKKPITDKQQQTANPSGNHQTGGRPADAGSGSSGAEQDPESRIAINLSYGSKADTPAPISEIGNSKPSSSSPGLEISPLLAAARQAMNPNGEIATVAALQTVDEQLAAMGLENDTERLYRRIGREEKTGPVDGEVAADVGAGPAGDDRGPETRSLARQAPTPKASPAADDASVGAGSSRNNNRGTESRTAANETETIGLDAPARKPEAAMRKPAPPVPKPPATEPATNNQQLAPGQLADQPTNQRATSAKTDSELVLGPLSRHPAGEVLQRFHAALQAGNIPGIAGAFTENAQFNRLRGRSRIADHFRGILGDAESLQVNLEISRLTREDAHWKVETDLEIRVQRNALPLRALAGRSRLWLVELDGRLAIDRMVIE